jgi:hypothetical protein
MNKLEHIVKFDRGYDCIENDYKFCPYCGKLIAEEEK